MLQTPSTSVLRFIYQVTRGYRWHIFGLALFAFYAGADISIGAYTIKLLLDSLQAAAISKATGFVFGAMILYITMVCIVTLIWRLNDLLLLNFLPSFEGTIVQELSKKITQQSHQFYQEHFSGAITSKINDVAESTPELLELLAGNVLWRFSTMIFAIITLWVTMPQVALVTLVWAIGFIGSALLTAQHIHKLSEQCSEARASISGATVDVTSNIFAVRLFNAQSRESGHLKNLVNDWTNAAYRRDWYLLSLFCFQGGLWVLREIVSISLIVHLFLAGKITVGDVTMFFSLSIMLINNVWNLTKDFGKGIKFLGKISQGLSTLLQPAEVVDIPHAPELLVHEGHIRFDNVRFRHRESNEILFDHLTVTVPAGQKVGLVGFSGSGKSTFANLMLRLYDVETGSIEIDGQNIAHVTQGSLRESVSFIPQDPLLFHRTLFENIQYGKTDATSAEVIEAARRAHADEFITILPQGYETCVGDRGVKLSGGQRQRVAIARAFLKHSRIFIMDEATSALDSMTEKYIQESFQQLMEGATTLVIAHRLATILSMDRILVFDKGRIVEDGTHEELIAQDGLYRKLWQAQSCGFLPDNAEEIE